MSVVLRLGRAWAVGDVCVEANGRELSVTVDDGSWRTVSLETMAADDGLLTVVIRTLGAKTTGGLGGPSPAGCAVREVAFDTPNGAVDAPKTISVVIPTYNRWDRLEATLEALDIQTHLPVEVVVVDDGSTDGTRMHLESLVAGRRFGIRCGRSPGECRPWQRAQRRPFLQLEGPSPLPGRRHDAGPRLPPGTSGHASKDTDALRCGRLSDWCRNSVRVTPFLEVVNTEGYQFGYGAMEDGHDVPLDMFLCEQYLLASVDHAPGAVSPDFTHAAWRTRKWLPLGSGWVTHRLYAPRGDPARPSDDRSKFSGAHASIGREILDDVWATPGASAEHGDSAAELPGRCHGPLGSAG